MRILTLLSFFSVHSANFLRGSSISVKDIPLSGSVAVTEENIWNIFDLADNSVQSYDSDIWASSGNAYITNVGIPIRLLSGEVMISANMKCADTRDLDQYLNLENWETYFTNSRILTSGTEDVYTNIWLKFIDPATVSDHTQCLVTMQITAIRDVNILFMVSEKSYQFGLVNLS
jgi:hypothetical protein